VRAGYSSASIKGEAVQNLNKLIDITMAPSPQETVAGYLQAHT
jgi:hypothetical protein